MLPGISKGQDTSQITGSVKRHTGVGDQHLVCRQEGLSSELGKQIVD